MSSRVIGLTIVFAGDTGAKVEFATFPASGIHRKPIKIGIVGRMIKRLSQRLSEFDEPLLLLISNGGSFMKAVL
jgi:hypothetical protein